MSLEAEPIEAGEPAGAYLTADEAREMAGGLPSNANLTALLALNDAALGAQLLFASIDIDMAMKYQGRKYDVGDGSVSGTVGVEQSREFPRVVDAEGFAYGAVPSVIGIWPAGSVWDWDPAANNGAGGPIVPELVKIATLCQAAWLMNSANSERIAAIRSGLASQGTASLSEAYRSAAELAAMGGSITLEPRAGQIMEKNYRLRSGRML